MAFFARNLHNNDASFNPLFRLLDDFDKYSRQESTQRRSWQPKFDVRETEDAFHLHGELPGLSKEDVSIEFPEPQTLAIHGKVERTYTTSTPQLEDDQSQRRNSFQASVEDEAEAEAKPNSGEVIEKPAAPVDNAKYWLAERSIGEFSRIFNFPSRVDQDAVQAGLKDGILSVVVPKAKKHETRRIAIN